MVINLQIVCIFNKCQQFPPKDNNSVAPIVQTPPPWSKLKKIVKTGDKKRR